MTEPLPAKTHSETAARLGLASTNILDAIHRSEAPTEKSLLGTLIDNLLDRTIFFSFDRSGFLRHARRFRTSDIEVDLSGRVCLVTGANSGIGRATATALASRGAEVWLLCRDPKRGEEAVASIRATTRNQHVHLGVVDMSDLDSIRAFTAGFAPDRVDVLIHNAGVLPATRQTTPQGLELTLATNLIGPFLLTQTLEAKLAATSDSRVIFVSSGGMYAERLSLADLQWQTRPFDGVIAYAQTKRMEVVLTELLADRWKKMGIAAHSMHPGWADTPSVKSSIPRFWDFMQNRLRTAEQGADTLIWLSIKKDLPSGRFWFDREVQSTHLLPFTTETPNDRQELWRLCTELAASSSPFAPPPA